MYSWLQNTSVQALLQASSQAGWWKANFSSGMLHMENIFASKHDSQIVSEEDSLQTHEGWWCSSVVNWWQKLSFWASIAAMHLLNISNENWEEEQENEIHSKN